MGTTHQATGDLTKLTLHLAAELVRARAVSPLELTRACLDRIAALDPPASDLQISAFITVTADEALAQARAAESEITAGRYRGALHGIPIALKDIVDVAGVRCTAASRVFADRIPQRDALIVEKLRDAGAVFLGKTNLHEFAYGGSGIIGAFGIARNPWNTAHICGGSSSGSAAAVAARMCYAAIGTDTAGSIRLPASLCGIVGHKPSFGRVSTRGVIPLCWSYDHIGPMTRTVRDAALVLDAIAGFDASDPNGRDYGATQTDAALDRPGKVRLGVVRDFFFADLDPEVVTAVESAIAVLESIVGTARTISIPVDQDRTVGTAESWVYHAAMVAEHADLYDPITLMRIRSGEKVSTTDFISKGLALQSLRNSVHEVFRAVDILITPTTPIPAPAIAGLQGAGPDLRRIELLMLRNTRPFNVLGLPTVSLPCGFTQSGLPIGLQLAAAPGADAEVLALAHAYEQATEWHKRFCDLVI